MNCESQVRDELYHHGILGQKWGVRRYQNADGSLTSAGQKKVAKYDKRIAYDKDYVKNAKAETEDIQKHGMNSKAIRKLYKEDLEAQKEAEFFGEQHISTLPKVRVMTDAKGNIKQIYGLDQYKVKDFLDQTVEDKQTEIAYTNKVIASLEKKRASLVGN